MGVEIAECAKPLPDFHHPERCIYLLGAEDNGLSAEALRRCHHVVQIPSQRCLNVASAGSIVLYDRIAKRQKWEELARAIAHMNGVPPILTGVQEYDSRLVDV